MIHERDEKRGEEVRIEVPIEENHAGNPEEPRSQNAAPGESGPDGDTKAFLERLKRLQAEFDNYKKRMARDAAALQERTVNQVLVKVLPLLDSIERACSIHGSDDEAAALCEGLQQIRSQFEQLLHSYEVEKVTAVGTPFDPAVHEAILAVESARAKNTVVEEVRPGYVRYGRTLRPAQVTVSQGPTPDREEDE
jgi:molecular chaperone GrpE